MIDRRFTQTQHRFASDDLETMREAHRYEAHLFHLFRPHIGKRVLEVGSGIGTMSRRLLDVAEHVVGIEPNQACADACARRNRRQPALRACASVISKSATARRWSPSGSTPSSCVNVLEHIEDDVSALRLFADIVGPARGHVLVWVPAVQAAHGPLDAELGHFRRYSKASLATAFAAAGLDLVHAALPEPDRAARVDVQRAVLKTACAQPRSRCACSIIFIAPGRCRSNAVVPLPIGSVADCCRPAREMAELDPSTISSILDCLRGARMPLERRFCLPASPDSRHLGCSRRRAAKKTPRDDGAVVRVQRRPADHHASDRKAAPVRPITVTAGTGLHLDRHEQRLVHHIHDGRAAPAAVRPRSPWRSIPAPSGRAR